MEKTIEINKIIFTQIENRYHFLNRDRFTGREYSGKLIADSFYPQFVCRNIANIRQPSLGTVKNSYAISERIAKDMGIKKLHISELITMLGYTKTDISKLLQNVKNRNIQIILVGIGGTGSNFLYFMHELTQWVGKDSIFQKIDAYDKDSYDVPNLLRIPYIPKTESNILDMTSKVGTIPKEFKLISNRFNSHTINLTKELIESSGSDKTRTVIYGAPDMETREWLYHNNHTFIAATHKDNEYSIIENPEIDQDLIIETYGKINLSMFFMNHLSMTISFLKHLAERTEPLGDYPGEVNTKTGKSVHGKRKNFTIDTKDFAVKHSDKIINGFKSGAKKLYVPTVGERNLDTGLTIREDG